MRRLILLVGVIFFNLGQAHSFSFGHFQTEMILSNDTLWHYYIGLDEPPANWYQNNFNESIWQSGKGGFGYGDNDDNTLIAQTKSVYFRRTFSISNLSEIESLKLYMDYDDGFIAYLNGIEVAKSANMTGTYFPFNYAATTSHEALLPTGGIPEEFIIDKTKLIQGLNILAIQVHNDKPGSSDLSSNAFLITEHSGLRGTYNKLPAWYKISLDDFSSDLPIVIITTQNGQEIVDEPKTTAHMSIVDNGKDIRNFYSDFYNEYDNYIGVELRGQSSLRKWDKVSYGIETRDSAGENNNVKLFGWAKENDWVLNASHYDKTLIRMPLTYWLSRKMGNFASHTQYCELFVNGEYKGLYIFMEKIKRDDNRIWVTEITPLDNSGEAVTGGYLIEYSSARWGIPTHFELHYPKEDKATTQQIDYINKYMSDFADLMQTNNYNDPGKGYPALIDIPSFVDEMLMQEFTKANDAYRYSSYFHKNRGEKLKAGPIWDFDQSFGNSVNVDGVNSTGFLALHEQNAHLFWNKLAQDNTFMKQYQKRWNSLRKGPFATDSIMDYIDKQFAKTREAQERNFAKWPILGVHLWREPDALVGKISYSDEVLYLKNWIKERAEWLDEFFYDETASANKFFSLKKAFSFPNPCSDFTNLFIYSSKSVSAKIEIISLSGKNCGIPIKQILHPGENSIRIDMKDLTPGAYICYITTDEGKIQHKIIKSSK